MRERFPSLVERRAQPDASNERERTADEIDALAAEVTSRDSAVAIVLGRLAESVRQHRSEETRAYAAAIDPRALAERLVATRPLIWGILEVARNVLIFAPIGVTWYGLSLAGSAYARLLEDQPDLITRPFLLLWQEGFRGAPGVFPFSTLANIDASLIALLILLSLAIHVRADVRDAATRARALLKESEIRGLIGHAVSVTTANDLPDAEADGLLDQMVAEERRIYERAMEREGQLLELEAAVRELRGAAAELARAAEALTRRKGRPGESRG